MSASIFLPDTGPSPMMQKALDHIGAAFRTERDEHQCNILTVCRLKQFVTEHRHTFQQAMEKLEAPRVEEMLWSFEWMVLDNVAMNIEYETELHKLAGYEREAWEWLKRITRQS